MTFASQETSRAQGLPIGLLRFTYGDGADDYFGYTDAEQIVDAGGKTYVPVPTDRDSIKASGSLDKTTLDVTLPQDCELSKFFDIYPPSRVVTLVIYEAHLGNDDVKVAWTGRVISNKIEGNAAIFTCEPISTSMRRSGLRRKYGYGCPHVLYGTDCNASEPAATVTITSISSNGPVVLLPFGWSGAIDVGKYINGKAKWTTADSRTEIRTIVRMVDATHVLLSGDASTLPGGGSIHLALGCSHQMGDCADLHSNIQNFGGQPWIPYKNPIGTTNNYF